MSIKETLSSMRKSMENMFESLEKAFDSFPADGADLDGNKVEWNTEETTETTEKRPDGTVVVFKKTVRKLKR